MSHFLLLSPFTCLDTRLNYLTSGPKKQNSLIWVQFFVEVMSLATNRYWFLWSLSYKELAVCPGIDVFICSCQCRGVSCLRSIFSAVDITGLYKVIKKGKEVDSFRNAPDACVPSLRWGTAGTVGVVGTQAPYPLRHHQEGQGTKYRGVRYMSSIKGENQRKLLWALEKHYTVRSAESDYHLARSFDW